MVARESSYHKLPGIVPQNGGRETHDSLAGAAFHIPRGRSNPGRVRPLRPREQGQPGTRSGPGQHRVEPTRRRPTTVVRAASQLNLVAVRRFRAGTESLGNDLLWAQARLIANEKKPVFLNRCFLRLRAAEQSAKSFRFEPRRWAVLNQPASWISICSRLQHELVSLESNNDQGVLCGESADRYGQRWLGLSAHLRCSRALTTNRRSGLGLNVTRSKKHP